MLSIRTLALAVLLACAAPVTVAQVAQPAIEKQMTPEEFKAWSQNLGHEQVLTTFSSYGQVGADRHKRDLQTVAGEKNRDTHEKC